MFALRIATRDASDAIAALRVAPVSHALKRQNSNTRSVSKDKSRDTRQGAGAWVPILSTHVAVFRIGAVNLHNTWLEDEATAAFYFVEELPSLVVDDGRGEPVGNIRAPAVVCKAWEPWIKDRHPIVLKLPQQHSSLGQRIARYAIDEVPIEACHALSWVERARRRRRWPRCRGRPWRRRCTRRRRSG